MATNYMSTYGKLIHQSGYNVVPIQPGTKRPGHYTPGGWTALSGWSSFCRERPADGTVEIWSSWPGCGVGIACGNVVAIDVDVLDEDVADDIEVVIRQRLGNTPLKRIGKAPKFLLVYRADAPFKKMRMGPIEALCDGQQFVAHSIHPDTGSEYTWTEERPFDVPLGLLPRVTQQQVELALQIAYEALPEEMRVKRFEVVSDSAGPATASDRGLTAHQDAILSALEFIENPDLHWDDWNKIGMALFASSNGEAWGHEAWHTFSARAAKNNPDETEARWGTYHRSRPTSIGAGTVFKLARDAGWNPPPGLDYHHGYIDTSDVGSEIIEMLASASSSGLTVIDGGLCDDVQPEPEQHEPLPPDGFTKPDGNFPFASWFEDKGMRPVSHVANWIYNTAPRPHPELALASTLAMFGAIFGRNFQMARYGTRTNMLLVGVAPTGSGKEYSRACIKRLMQAADLLNYLGGDDIKSGAAVESMLKEHPARINMMDEFGLYLQGVFNMKAEGYKKEIGKKMLEFYSASSSMYKGSQYANQKDNPSVVIHNPIWCVYGTTTVETLRPVLQQSTQQDGTLPRMMFFDAQRRPAQRFDVDTTLPPPQPIVDFLQSIKASMPGIVGDLAAINSYLTPAESKTVEWTEESFEMFKAMSRWCDQLVEKRGVVWTRAMENTIKIGMIDAISADVFRPVLTPRSLQKAFDLIYWATTFLEKMIQTEGAENETDATQKKVLRTIMQHMPEEGGMTTGKIITLTTWLKKRERQEILEDLCDQGKLRSEVIKPGKQGGRPGVRYFLR